jgi:hypothetical protein
MGGVGDSPEGPLKQLGKSRLKPAKKPKLNAPCLNAHTGVAHAAVAPAAHQGGPLKGPLEQAPPRSRVHAFLGRALPCSRVHASLGRAPPLSRMHRMRTPVPARGYGHLMLRQRRGGAIMRLRLTPQPCCTNSLGVTHPRHCGRLCDMAGVSPVTPHRLLPYG